MIASIATGPEQTPSESPETAGDGWLEASLQRVHPILVGLALFVLALVVYLVSNPQRADFFNHFVWQADAFLAGRAEIAYPVSSGPHQNYYLHDVLPVSDGFGQIPFPPLPAVVLLPFVAIFGLDANGSLVASLLGALNVALCWAMLLAVTPRRSAALLGSLFYGFGTVAWYAAMLGSTWFLAHVVASTFLFLAIIVAVRSDPASGAGRALGRAAGVWRQVVAGWLFGVAALARLTTIFGAPFFVFVGPGGTWLRRALAAGFGAAVPVVVLLAYNLGTTGAVLHPAYEYLYATEFYPRPELVNRDWGIEDPRYLPQNAAVMLAWPPELPLFDDPACSGADVNGPDLLIDLRCPLVRPDPFAMSILLTSPAYLLMLPVLLRSWRRRLVAGAGLAVLAIALVDLMHFSQGWVQFGYRFSNDFAPFAMILVGLGIAGLGVRPLTVGLVAWSIAVNTWGVYWGVSLGW